MTDAEILAKSQRTKDLLERPEIVEAFETVRQNLLKRFESLPVSAIDEIMETKQMLTNLWAVKANLQSVVDSGKVVTDKLNWLEKAKGKVNAFRN